MHPSEPELRGDQIQANAIAGFNTRSQRLISLWMTDPGRAREWLAARLRPGASPAVTTLAKLAAQRPGKDARRGPLPETWLNLCFSYDGLRLLGGAELGAEPIQDAWFKRGMAAVAGSLGDGDLASWRDGGREKTTAHVLAILADNCSKQVGDACERLIDEAVRHGMEPPLVDRGERRDDMTEPFGFRDGISVPAVRGLLDGRLLAARRPPGVPLAARYSSTGRPLVWPGQAVFGYPGPSRTSAVEPGEPVHGGRRWMDNGSFLVFRRLRQDVEAFRAFLADAAARLSARVGREVTRDEVGALLVGRWPNGSPLIRHPEAPGHYDIGANDFGYLTETPAHELVDEDGRTVPVAAAPPDPHGTLCPHIAHIRKVNPRDAPTDLAGEAMAFALQPLRRGIPYEDDGERGLLFLAYTTAIEARFGALSRGWINQRGVPEPRSDAVDPLVGPPPANGARTIVLRVGGTSVGVEAPSRWVEPAGGGFFFSPSMDLLRTLARPR